MVRADWCMGWGKRVGIGVGIRVDWVVYGCFRGMGRFGVR